MPSKWLRVSISASGERPFSQSGVQRGNFEIKRELGERERLARKIHRKFCQRESRSARWRKLSAKGFHLRLDQWSQKLLIANSACLRDPRRFGKILQERRRMLPKSVTHGAHEGKVIHSLVEADGKNQEGAKKVGRHAHRVPSTHEQFSLLEAPEDLLNIDRPCLEHRHRGGKKIRRRGAAAYETLRDLSWLDGLRSR